MKKQIYDEKNGLSYTLHGDYYLPDLEINEEEPTYGKYGIMRKQFLKEHRSARYQYLVLTGKLTEHLNQVDKEAREKVEMLVEQMAEQWGVTEIIDETPSFAFKLKDIDILREAYLSERYRSENRELTVTYLFGASGTGKTSGIYKKHPASEICRITDYNGKNGVRFDSYHGQDILVFEEFNSQIPIETMLNYLDIYPLTLPARYSDRTACYTKVYITSNLPLNE